MTEPVIVTLLGKNYWDSTLRTPWGEAEWCRPLPQPVPGKPGHVQVGHLIVFPAEDGGELLASGEMRHDPEGYYYSVTTDGDRVFLHVWAENGNWVWVLHEMRVDRGDRCFFLGHDPDRWLLGVGLRSSHDPHLKHSDRNMVRVECPSCGRAHWLPLGQATTRCPMRPKEQHELLGLLGSGQKLHCDLPAPA